MLRRFFSQAAKSGPKKITNRDALRMGMSEEMRRNPNIFLIGEEVGQY